MKVAVIKETEDRGFIISWQEPPWTTSYWTANVTPAARQRESLMGRVGAKVVIGATRDDMLARAKQYVDQLVT